MATVAFHQNTATRDHQQRSHPVDVYRGVRTAYRTVVGALAGGMFLAVAAALVGSLASGEIREWLYSNTGQVWLIGAGILAGGAESLVQALRDRR